jgi:ribonuclease HI
VIRYAAQLIFVNDEHSTNNTTEYEALLLAVRKMKALGQQPSSLRQTPKLFRNISKRERSKKSCFDEVP